MKMTLVMGKNETFWMVSSLPCKTYERTSFGMCCLSRGPCESQDLEPTFRIPDGGGEHETSPSKCPTIGFMRRVLPGICQDQFTPPGCALAPHGLLAHSPAPDLRGSQAPLCSLGREDTVTTQRWPSPHSRLVLRGHRVEHNKWM